MSRTKDHYFGIEPILEEYLNPANAWKYEAHIHRAMDEFLGAANGPMPDAAFSHFADWFLFDYVMQDGTRAIEKFVSENPADLAVEVLHAYADLPLENSFDFFDVMQISKTLINLVSLHDKAEYAVRLPGRSLHTQKGDVMASRIGKIENEWRILSLDPIAMPYPSERDRARIISTFPIPNAKFIYQDILAQEGTRARRP